MANIIAQHEIALSKSKEASAYLQKRGISPATAKRFRLGYCSVHNSIEFPIATIDGTVVAIGSRGLDADGHYWNSPDSPRFHKSEHLYGIHQAAGNIGAYRVAVVVEGYFDVLTAHAHNCLNVVGIMGTSLSTTHIQTLLDAGAKRIILTLDGDEAGWAALRRIAFDERLADNYLLDHLWTAILPNGEDPDSFIRENHWSWRDIIYDAIPLYAHIIGRELVGIDPKRIDTWGQKVRDLFPVIANMNPCKREYTFICIAHRVEPESPKYMKEAMVEEFSKWLLDKNKIKAQRRSYGKHNKSRTS